MNSDEMAAIRERAAVDYMAHRGGDHFAGRYMEAREDVLALLDALAAERALSDALADLLDVAAREAHATGPAIDHWGTPVGDGPVLFERCDDEWCEAARDNLENHRKSREAER